MYHAIIARDTVFIITLHKVHVGIGGVCVCVCVCVCLCMCVCVCMGGGGSSLSHISAPVRYTCMWIKAIWMCTESHSSWNVRK